MKVRVHKQSRVVPSANPVHTDSASQTGMCMRRKVSPSYLPLILAVAAMLFLVRQTQEIIDDPSDALVKMSMALLTCSHKDIFGDK